MQRYLFRVEDTLARTIVIEAEDENEAKQKMEEQESDLILSEEEDFDERTVDYRGILEEQEWYKAFKKRMADREESDL